MPPISSPLFTEAQTTYEGISRRLKDLNEYQIPRLRDCKGPLTLQQQFAAELRDDIDALAKRLEDFSTLAEDQERENERTQVKQWVTDLSNELARVKSESRNALLASKRAIDSDAKSRRDELLGSTSLQEKRAADAEAHKQQATEDKLMAASDDVTEALRRTTRLMQQELERSVLSTQMLEESSKTLRATSDSYTSIDNLMDVSQVLIKALQRADWIDRIIIGLSLGVFLLTVAYIIKRRVLDRVVAVATLPVRLMIIWFAHRDPHEHRGITTDYHIFFILFFDDIHIFKNKHYLTPLHLPLSRHCRYRKHSHRPCAPGQSARRKKGEAIDLFAVF
ncbi:hypothetical protein RhiJN_17848 [Ceratobasidium sp. AG-Ba]|nr:hypothetical protein RhiJN_17848 [Ceratobasidium sp. AG-Ba]